MASSVTDTAPVSLLDIKKTGEEHEFDVLLDDGSVIKRKVWIQRLSVDDAEEVFKRANAAKGIVLATMKDPDSELARSIDAQIFEWDEKMLIDFLVIMYMAEREPIISAQHAYEEDSEWAKDDYLDSLRLSWIGAGETEGLREEYARNPENVDAANVLAELTRFVDEVEKIVAQVTDRKRSEFRQDHEDDLRRRVREELVKGESERAFARELHDCQIWIATRKVEDHTVREFDRRADIDLLDEEIRKSLVEGYRRVAIPSLEGKDSPAARVFSALSEFAGEQDPSTPFSLPDAND